jgi:hypothetical protein
MDLEGEVAYWKYSGPLTNELNSFPKAGRKSKLFPIRNNGNNTYNAFRNYQINPYLIFHNKKGLHNMRNLPETPIIFLVYLPKCYFVAFFGTILIAISEINYIKQCTDRNYVHKHAYLGSD